MKKLKSIILLMIVVAAVINMIVLSVSEIYSGLANKGEREQIKKEVISIYKEGKI